MKILVCGLGALGSNILSNLCCDLRDNKEIYWYGIDYDIVEDRNIMPGTQIYFEDQIGLNKTSALKLNIYRMCKIRVNMIDKKIEDYEWLRNNNECDLIIDCLNNKHAK